MMRVAAPSRLHFGLFQVAAEGDPQQRRFGGVGLMIDRPGVAVAWQSQTEGRRVEGIHAARALEFALRFERSLAPDQRRPYALLVERCPPQHVGLGVGTQLGLAIAKVLAAAAGYDSWPATLLAPRIGRGERSAVGIHGFDHGGLIIEAGKTHQDTISPLWHHVRLPEQWRVVLLLLSGGRRWYGADEQAAFAYTAPSAADRLRRLAVEGIVPAARQGDLQAFGQAVYEFNRLAGEPFAPIQGGIYSSPQVEQWVMRLRQAGIPGVGQSSWGPTVFAVVGDEDTARYCLRRWRDEVPIQITRIAAGHRLSRWSSTDGHTLNDAGSG